MTAAKDIDGEEGDVALLQRVILVLGSMRVVTTERYCECGLSGMGTDGRPDRLIGCDVMQYVCPIDMSSRIICDEPARWLRLRAERTLVHHRAAFSALNTMC